MGVKSGSLLAYIGSSAGAGYFPKEVIVDGENQYPIECSVRPYPTFEGGHGYMSQRGGGYGNIPFRGRQQSMRLPNS